MQYIIQFSCLMIYIYGAIIINVFIAQTTTGVIQQFNIKRMIISNIHARNPLRSYMMTMRDTDPRLN
jgi:hypothetical protein